MHARCAKPFHVYMYWQMSDKDESGFPSCFVFLLGDDDGLCIPGREIMAIRGFNTAQDCNAFLHAM